MGRSTQQSFVTPSTDEQMADVHVTSAIQRLPIFSDPLKGTLAPGVDQSDSQDENEKHSLQHHIQRQYAVGGRPGEQEDRLNIEYDKHQGKYVVLDFELDPRLANGLHSTFIGRLLDRIRFVRREQSGQKYRDGRDHQANRKEKSGKDPLIEHPCPSRGRPAVFDHSGVSTRNRCGKVYHASLRASKKLGSSSLASAR